LASYQLLTSGIGITCALFILFLVRRDLLHTRHTLWWLAVAATTTVFGVFPQLSDIMARYVGVAYPPTLILTLALIILGVKTLFMDIERSQHELQIRRLAQRVALYESVLMETAKGDERILAILKNDD
jgi:hypothetical protein